MNGQRVVEVETQEEFLHYLNLGPVRAPREIGESLAFTDALPLEEWEEELKGEREWEELQKEWADNPASAVVIPFPVRER